MGRELKRVPLDFDYPLHKVWYGYLVDIGVERNPCDGDCELCNKIAKILDIPYEDGCPDFLEYLRKPIEWMRDMLSPPVGDGYQYWETTSEGSPISPVFATIDELAEWLAESEDKSCSKEEWVDFLKDFEVWQQKHKE